MIPAQAAGWILIAALSLQIVQSQFPNHQGQYNGARVRGSPTGARPAATNENYEYNEGDVVHPLAGGAGVHRFRSPSGYIPVKLHPCEQSSCYPATGNLLIGREDQLYASSTCGLHGRQRYCIVSHLEERKKCFWCDSTPSSKLNPALNHNISNIVSLMFPGTRQKSWWQSENGKENVYIQLDLEAEFHFTHLIITFKTFRPAAMLIERSYDFNKTWQVYRYFAHNCAESFPGIREGYPENLTDVVCESRYSSVAPSTDGEIIYRVLPPTLHIDNPYSEEVQSLLKMTNLRINFTELHTLGDDLLDRREEIQEKYYYAITDMVVRGSCSCYGHANRCLPLPGIQPISDMVHGRCECTHNTKGRNCEKCEDFFNDLPWRPAIGKQTNACRKCNCNNHAKSCHFDAAYYESTGRISGGICDGCQHNTMGPHCELCKPFYYRDPSKDVQDPEICRPCDCDPHGSTDNGICDSMTDSVNGFVAGSCHCKAHVEGRRCDICKNGFWNFSSANPLGCESCTCHTEGTINNQGCNVYSGECTCKRYVVGRNCNQCLPEYWGLSNEKDGCRSCDCDPGGSFDNNCDVINGQCKCRDHMVGRNCSIPKEQHFTASLDFLLYEAELAKSSPNCQVVIREPYRDGSDITWTGTGFVKAFEKSYIEFTIDNIMTSMDYEIGIRYEPTLPNDWAEIEVNLERPGPVDPNGPCHAERDDFRRLGLPANGRSTTVFPPYCLEAGRSYKVRLSFVRSNFDKESPTASILIDSIVLLPKIDVIPWFHGSAPAEQRHREFERNRCGSYPAYAIQQGQVPEICKQFYSSIGAYIFNGAFSCHCDVTGSESKTCDIYGGTCTCRTNVVGRRCDRCAPGTYGFSPDGCRACDCNSIGSLDNFCSETTGQCKCRANTYGRACNLCRTGFWNFPNCQRCECNGHEDKCGSETGICEKCRDNTQGDNCDQCIEGYYGDPRLNVDIPCRPCPCPGAINSNHSHADRCSLDPYTKDVVCECKYGYSGARCDVCADNFYGNPEEAGGECYNCECNNKTDPFMPGNCDPHTGKCLKCLYNTTGDHCEVCQPGFFRYSSDEPCIECVCHLFGTNSSAGPCDPHTGQCPCLPNVTELKCDKCLANHWRLASGEGCSPCNCDPQGSTSPQCNEYDGQCYCKPKSGGTQCNECMARSWGDPQVECKECKCNQYGSRTLQCDMRTGACLCLPGMGGYNCDRCARGFLGNAPECTPCGECFDNWDRILEETRNETLRMIDRAGDIKKVGATGAYTKEFDEMQYQLDEIDQLLNNTDEINIDAIDQEFQVLRSKIDKTEAGTLKALDNSLANTKETMLLTDLKLDSIKKRIDDLKNRTKQLEVNGTQLQEANVQGALTLIQNAKIKADVAAHKVEHSIVDTVDYAERQIKATEHYVDDTSENFKQQQLTNENKLEELREKLLNLRQVLPELNDLVCDGHGDPCDSVCGGAGCSSCGSSITCEDGAKQLAETALTLANTTESELRSKESQANDFIRNVSQINSTVAKSTADEAFDKATSILIQANSSLTSARNLNSQINEFSSQNNTKPEDIKQLANQVLAMKIHLEPHEITVLAKQILDAVHKLTNIEPIIEATREHLETVTLLKKEAEDAKTKANAVFNVAGNVTKSLANTTEAQEEAQSAITIALEDINKVKELLDKIGNETEMAQNKTGSTARDIQKLEEHLRQLQRNITDNEHQANRAVNESAQVAENAKNAYDNFNTLQSRYSQATVRLEKNVDSVESTKDRAESLFDRALKLISDVSRTDEAIAKLASDSHEEQLNDLENQLQLLISQMNKYTAEIENKVQFYKICN